MFITEIKPKVISAYLVGETISNSSTMESTPSASKVITRNVTDPDYLNFLPHITSCFQPVNGKPDFTRPSAVSLDFELKNLNSNGKLNINAGTTVVLNFSAQPIYVKGNIDLPDIITPLQYFETTNSTEPKQIYNAPTNMVCIIRSVTMPVPGCNISGDDVNYLQALKDQYTDRKITQKGLVCETSEAVVNYLLEHQTKLFKNNNVTPVRSFVRVLVAYEIPLATITKEEDKTVVIHNIGLMLSTNGYTTMASYGEGIKESLLWLHRTTNPNSKAFLEKLGKTIFYYNDPFDEIGNLYYNNHGVVKQLVNIRQITKPSCVTLEDWNSDTDNYDITRIPFSDIANGTNLFVFRNRADAEKAKDPYQNAEVIKAMHETKNLMFKDKTIDKQIAAVTAETQKIERSAVHEEQKATLDMSNHVRKADIDMSGYVLRSTVDAEKAQFDIEKFKREQTQERSKNMWMGVSAATAVLGLATAIAGGVFGKKS